MDNIKEGLRRTRVAGRVFCGIAILCWCVSNGGIGLMVMAIGTMLLGWLLIALAWIGEAVFARGI